MRRLLPLLLLMSSLGLSGCATSRLWDDGTILVAAGEGDGPVEFSGDSARCYRNAAGSLAYPGKMTTHGNGKDTVVSGFLIVPAEETKLWKSALLNYAPTVTARAKVEVGDFVSGYPVQQHTAALSFPFIVTDTVPTGYLPGDDSNVSEESIDRRIDDELREKAGPFRIVYNPVGRTSGSDAWNTAAKVAATPVSLVADCVMVTGVAGAMAVAIVGTPFYAIGEAAFKAMKPDPVKTDTTDEAKNLFVNKNRLTPGDQGAREREQSDEGGSRFFKTHEQFPEAVQP